MAEALAETESAKISWLILDFIEDSQYRIFSSPPFTPPYAVGARQCDGGGDNPENTVMACADCNGRRGETLWEDYLEQMEPKARANLPAHAVDLGYGDTSKALAHNFSKREVNGTS